MGTLANLIDKNNLIVDGINRKLTPPKWMRNAIHYETIMGSVAYGVSEDDSDFDIYAVCIPPKNVIFPHLNGYIMGFGRRPDCFENWQQHHVRDPDALGGRGRDYDFVVYSIVKYFDLCMGCNPNMIDSLFTPQRCVLHCTKVGNIIRENRKIFLSKKAWHTFKGYAYQQLHKMATKTPEKGSKRYESIQKHKFDVKYAYHLVRLLLEVEQILSEGDLEIDRKSNRELLKAIRRGEVSEKRVRQITSNKETYLEGLYQSSDAIPNRPDEMLIKSVLINCLEEHFGSLNSVVHMSGRADSIINQIQAIIEQYNSNR